MTRRTPPQITQTQTLAETKISKLSTNLQTLAEMSPPLTRQIQRPGSDRHNEKKLRRRRRKLRNRARNEGSRRFHSHGKGLLLVKTRFRNLC